MESVTGCAALPALASEPIATFGVRGQCVVLDADIARLFGVPTKRLNEQLRRNLARFAGYAFQLTDREVAGLRSQIATSKVGRGGRRYRPWVFTEHRVVMAATILNSDVAIAAMRLVVETFVAARRRGEVAPTPGGLGPKLRGMLESVLDTLVDHRAQTTVRDEAQELLSESIQHLKARLSRAGLENEEIAARATKLLADAELSKAMAAKSKAEASEVEFALLARKLRLMIEAERTLSASDTDGFLRVLGDLGAPGSQVRP